MYAVCRVQKPLSSISFGAFIFHCVYQNRLMILHKLTYKAIKLHTFFQYSTSKIDDLAQKCMHSTKSTISFGTLYKIVHFLSLYGFVGKSVCKIVNLFWCTQWKIRGPKEIDDSALCIHICAKSSIFEVEWYLLLYLKD